MFGLGKSRSKFGRFLDKHGISQEEVRKVSKRNKDTITKACTEDDPKLREITKKSLTAAAKKISGKNVRNEDFWQ
ncbi:transcriptional regulator [Acinetobacter sp. CUI P1]|nr:transcriptional regulator [Acinetobacter sp. CUI P1]